MVFHADTIKFRGVDEQIRTFKPGNWCNDLTALTEKAKKIRDGKITQQTKMLCEEWGLPFPQ